MQNIGMWFVKTHQITMTILPVLVNLKSKLSSSRESLHIFFDLRETVDVSASKLYGELLESKPTISK